MLAGKVLARLCDSRGVVDVDILHERRPTKSTALGQLLGKSKTTYWSKRHDVPIHSVLLLHNYATPNAATINQEKLQ